MRSLRNVFLLSVILLLQSSLVLAQDDVISYKFIGTVGSQEEVIMDAEIRVFDKNEVIKTTYSDKKGRFEVLLIQGSTYTVEISKDGFYIKRMLFDTRVEEGVKKLPTLKFEVEMTSLELYQDVEASSPESTSILDFPTAIIEYDSDLGDFNYREAYSRHIMEEIKKIRDPE